MWSHSNYQKFKILTLKIRAIMDMCDKWELNDDVSFILIKKSLNIQLVTRGDLPPIR